MKHVRVYCSKSCSLQKQSFVDILKNMCSLKFCKFHRKTPVQESIFNNVACLRPATFLKRDSYTGVSSKICEIFNNTFFYRTPPAANFIFSRISNRYRSSCPQVFFKRGVLQNFPIFTVKHLCWSLFLLKRDWNLFLLKGDSNTGVFL